MEIIPIEIMKNDRDLELFWVNPQLQITVLMRKTPVLSSNMAMISDSHFSTYIFLPTKGRYLMYGDIYCTEQQVNREQSYNATRNQAERVKV